MDDYMYKKLRGTLDDHNPRQRTIKSPQKIFADYWKNPNQYMESYESHINVAAYRYIRQFDKSINTLTYGIQTKMLHFMLDAFMFDIKWHYIFDKDGNVITEEQYRIISVNEKTD